MNRRSVSRRRIRAQRVYRLLVRLYPPAHRRTFGEQMVQAFGDHYRDAVQGRGGSTVRFWLAVLADTATSLLTEHAARLRAPGRRAATARRRRRDGMTGDGSHLLAAPRRSSVRRMRGFTGRPGRGMKRPMRVRRRLRYRRSACRPVRVVIRTRHHRLVYRGRLATLLLMLLLAAVVLGVGIATAHLAMSAVVAGLVVSVWLGYRLRLVRPVPAGPGGDGPAPPGGAGMREPRRPLPMSPAGSAARPRLEHDSPGQAAALI
jgi:hypothetical protein